MGKVNAKEMLRLIASVFLLTACQRKVGFAELPSLKVSENKRYLMTGSGEPFFWLGDTGWLLFGNLSREEADIYLQDRADKGFNVIQIMVLHTMDYTNYYGDSALIDGNAATPQVTAGNDFLDPEQYDFWDHADYIIDLAAAKRLYVGLVPVWGSNVKAGAVNVEQAAIYADWLANRYEDRSNVIWLNGGDLRGDIAPAVWNTIGETIKRVSPGQLMTFHPRGRTTSSIWFHEKDWLDFNMFQSGHRRYDQDDTEWCFGEDNWRYVTNDLALLPPKPTLDGEPSYEGIPQGLHDTQQPYWMDNDVRRYAYWSVFSGSFGHTYGHSAVMQFYQPGDKEPAYGANVYWTEAKDATGAQQMKNLKKLMLSRPYFERVPDQSLISGVPGEKYEHLLATRGKNYAMIYSYTGRDIPVVMAEISGEQVKASWFNPRTGTESEIGEFENKGLHTFDCPGETSEGNDWVLVLDSIKPSELL